MVHEPPVKPTVQPSLGKLEGKTPLVVFLVLALAIGTVGYAIFAHLNAAIRQDKYHELSAVGDLKVSQIVGWLGERRGDAAATTRDPILAQAVQRWLERGAPHDEAARRIEARLQGLREAYGYDKVILLDRGIRAALVAGDALHQHAHAESNQRAAEAMSAGQPLLADLHLEAEAEGAPAEINIDLYAPLLEAGRRVVGIVYFQIDPYRFLFPFVQAWPTPSKSAETLLVRRDGDDVLYLNELRHRKDSALRFRLPLNTPDLPAARSLRGETGVIEGVDYRGVPVLAALRTVPGTSWHLVAKIERAEVFAPMRNLAIGVGAVVAVLIAGAGMLVALWWRRQRAEILAMHFKAEFERQALSKHLDLMSRYANDSIFLYDEAGRILEANERAVEHYGYPRDELIGMPASQLSAPSAAIEASADVTQSDEAGSGLYETLHRRKDGSEFPVEASYRVIRLEDRRLTQAIIRGISERRLAEEAQQASEERYRLIAESSSDVITVIDGDNRITFASPATENVFGYSADEMIGQSLSVLMPEDLRSSHQEALKRYIETGQRTVNWKMTEFRGRHKSGREFPIEISFGEFVQDGKRAFAGIIRDISARKKAEARIVRLASLKDALSGVNHAIVHAEREESLFDEICSIMTTRAGFDSASIGIADPKTGDVKWVAYAGAAGAVIAKAHRSVSTDRPEGRGPTGTAIREARHVVCQDFVNDPSTAPWHTIGIEIGIGSTASFPILRAGKAVGVINVDSRTRNAFDGEMVALLDEAAQDVSFALDNLDGEAERKRIHEELGESEERFRGLTELSSDYYWKQDEQFRFIERTSSPAEKRPFPVESILGKTRWELPALNMTESDWAAHRAELAAHKEFRNLEIERPHPHGRTRWISTSGRPIFDHEGVFRGYRGIGVDITERRLAETELRAAEEQFRGLVEQSISGIWIIQDRRIVYANPRIAEIFGYASPEELVGRDVLEVVAEKDRALVTENIRRRMDGEVKSIAYTLTGLRKDGAPVEIGGQGTIASFHGRPAIIGVLQDITERKRTEEEAALHLAELQQAMMATVRVASTMGEMRDPYTSGHERRVGELSAAIGAELGLSEHHVEGLRVAGYLHDLGKIMVPSEILSKPGKISPIEFALIKEHAKQGYEILKDVNFPWPVALVALQHHERLGGTGYPQGLKGDEIILEARILAVADTVEAMASHRPYRPGLGIEAALAEIERYRDEHYCRQAVDACVRLFREQGYQLPA